MDVNTLFTFGVPTAVLGTMIYRRVFKRPARQEGNTSPEKIAEQLKDATDDQPLAMRAWLDYLNNQPDAVPHIAFIGGSGAGKTTTATAVLNDRPGQIVIISAKEGDPWGGLDYIGIDLDATYTTANATFAQLDAEVKRRLIAVKQKRLTADWLTVVLDDYSTLRTLCDNADEPFKLVARLGRSLRVRLIVLSDSALVKAWGIEGEGETRANFAFVRLKRGHIGTLEIDGKLVPIDTSLVKRVAEAARLGHRGWKPARDPEAELADLLGPPAPAVVGNKAQNDEGRAGGRAGDEDDDTPEPRRDALIKALQSQKLGRDAIRDAVRAAGFKIGSKRLSELMKE